MLKSLVYLALLLGLLSCNSRPEMVVPPGGQALDRFARSFIVDMLAGLQESCWNKLAPVTRDARGKTYLATTISNLQGQPLRQARLMEYELQTGSATLAHGLPATRLSYEVVQGRRYVLLSVVVQPQQSTGRLAVRGFSSEVLPAPLAELARFSLAGKSAGQLGFLALMAGTVLFIFTTLGFVLRLPVAWKTRLQWAALVLLLNVIRFQLNWQTGEVDFQLLHLNIFGGINFGQAGLAAPWVVSLNLPLGALYFWLKRPGLLAEANAPEPAYSYSSQPVA